MPKREDEYHAGTSEPRGVGLCPFCGSPEVYYNEVYRSWRCGRCEKSFPSPSYGPGKDSGQDTRRSGKSAPGQLRRPWRMSRGLRWTLIVAGIIALVLLVSYLTY